MLFAFVLECSGEIHDCLSGLTVKSVINCIGALVSTKAGMQEYSVETDQARNKARCHGI